MKTSLKHFSLQSSPSTSYPPFSPLSSRALVAPSSPSNSPKHIHTRHHQQQIPRQPPHPPSPHDLSLAFPTSPSLTGPAYASYSRISLPSGSHYPANHPPTSPSPTAAISYQLARSIPTPPSRSSSVKRTFFDLDAVV
ncbi:uncharacterized protein BDZ99DRAFT_469267 [Mytilinidion resinicola]|uniref:Uncharacterized protein n=1 Tax=Mytilinidion resinicola TaxID=574789 RepID=A0A6A6Y0D7_9PEZI|nr:uncharacterized protein BDZ99DRAFT_469267 [Mytilinidion resinicola]KAF2801983.1 hypothetical protein BDZ99DRAFT_469267 [Mytilinidion resinicola]